jgi:putative ABC transport system permease protein
MSISILYSGFIQGGVLALLAFALMIPFRYLNLPDLSAEGAYTLGGTLMGVFLLSGFGPVQSLIGASVLSGLVGLATVMLHLQYSINCLLAGVIISGMTYSVNLRIMGVPNISLFNQPHLFGRLFVHDEMIIIFMVLLLVCSTFYLFLRTVIGLKFRAVGHNPSYTMSIGINNKIYLCSGFYFSGMISGLAGAVSVSLNQYVDINMGVGIILNALAALMLGEALFNMKQSMFKQISSPIIGALVFQQLSGLILSQGFPPSDYKLISALAIITLLGLTKKHKMSEIIAPNKQ